MEQMPPTPDASFDPLYSPLQRLLPPLRRAPASVLNSLHVVEAYFGAELSSKMVETANRLSARQLFEVEIQVRREATYTDEALSLVERPWQPPEQKPWWRKTRTDREEERYFGSNDDLDFLPWAQRPHIALAREIAVHEDLLPHIAMQPDLNQASALKHLALYSEHTAIRDPLQENKRLPLEGTREKSATDTFEERRRRFTNGLRQLLPIAPLIRDGTFILVGDSGYENRVFDSPYLKNDPFMAWILEQHQPELMQEITELHTLASHNDDSLRQQAYTRLNDLGLEAHSLLRRYYPYNVSDQAWERLLTMSQWSYRYSLAPATTDPILTRHLAQGAKIALGGQPDLRDTTGGVSPIGAAVTYQVPSLDNTLFSHLIRLRESNLFADVRKALLQVVQTCAESAPQNYDAYQKLIAECAQDIVGPLYRQVARRRRWDKLAMLGISATSEVLDMQINGIAGKAVGGAVKRLGGHVPRKRFQQADVAHTVLKSILLYK